MKNSLTCFARRGSIRRSTWIAGKGGRNRTAFTSARLQFAEWWAHHTKSIQTCKESVESFRVHDHGGLPRFIPENGRILVGGRFWKLVPVLATLRLDPTHYYTSPGLSWDAVLKETGVQLELLTDVDMHLFIEQGTRRGISMVSKRFAKANNPHVTGYVPDKPNSFIQCLDANNLYGCAMCKTLPKGKFACKTVMPTEEQILAKKEQAKQGWIL